MPSRLGVSASPFLDAKSFEAAPEPTARLGLSSPFVQAFATEPEDVPIDPRGASRRLLLAELYDEELDDAIYEVVGEAAAAFHPAHARPGAASLRMRLDPLARELEALAERAADRFGTRDPVTIAESEIDEVFANAAPSQELTPAFEQLFGRVGKAFSRVAKGAVNVAKRGIEAAAKLGLGPVFNQLKKLVRPLLERVLKSAIDRLPVPLQPAARNLASKLPALFGHEVEGYETIEPAVDIGSIQREFNEQVADVLLGGDEGAREHETADWNGGGAEAETTVADLDAARDRFVTELGQLQDGEDPGPAVERFVPALLPALKLGLRLAGRKRVVSLLSGLVSKLIARFVGPASAGALSTALVDSGLKLIGLEVSPAEQQEASRTAIASTVEETVRRVAALPDAVLENGALLEASVVRAFEDAAASNLPPLLPAAVYRQRPELAETDARHGTWIACPLRGPKRYKKFGRVIHARITPRIAMAVKTFGGVPLAHYLQEQLGFEPGDELEADVHLFESTAGTVLGEVARLEANGHGPAAVAEFHPLTMEAAALLAHEPGLGRAGTAGSPRDLAVGNRFYRIVVPGHRLAVAPGSRKAGRRPTSLHMVLDFPGDRVRLYLFLAERRAQELAAALRKQGHPGAIATTLKDFVDRGLANAMGGRVLGRVRILHEALSLEETRGAAMHRLPRSAAATFAARVSEWALKSLNEFVTTQSARFVAASEDAQDGITLVITVGNPPGMSGLRKLMSGVSPNGDLSAPGEPASIQVDVVPGFTNG